MRTTFALLMLAAAAVAAPPPPPVLAPDLAKPIELALPSPPDEAVLAGNGRYIAFVCPDAKQVAVVDVTAGAIAKGIPFTDDDVRVVGTLSRLFVYTPRSRSFQGYKVGAFEEDGKPKFLPAAAPNEAVGSLVAAPGVDGLVIMQFPRAKLTAGFGIFQPKPGFGALTWSHFGPRNAWGPAELRISHTGTLLVGWGGGYAGLEAAVIRGVRADVWEDQYKFGPVRWAMPSADGQYVYLANGHLTRTMTFAGGQKKDQAYTFPGVDPGFYLTVPTEAAQVGEPALTREAKRNSHGSGPLPEVTLYAADNQKVTTIKADTLAVATDLPPEKRVFFYSAANMLVTVGGPKKTTVKLERLSVKDELDRAGGDYLLVASAPTTATRNSKFTYPLVVLSKKGGVTAKLDRGPPGMKVAGTTLTWEVPFEFKDRYASFQVSVSDASGKSVIHLGQLVILSP